ncbi:MAG: SURF1 family protein [Burkholderiales bacterium]|nr:SURF1 family protein [Burkholderiales bacterium]
MKLKQLFVLAAALAGVAVTLALGSWQWGRAQEKEALQEAIVRLGQMKPLDGQQLAAAPDLPALVHRAVVLTGRWQAQHTVFLDNRQVDGRPGFFVVTPLCLEGGRHCFLVQRGWAPRDFQDRLRLPPVQTPADPVTVYGRLAPPPAKLYEFDAAGEGPIRQNLEMAAFRAETRLPLADMSVLELGPSSQGLSRNWPQPASGSHKNYGYAFQWWALAGLIAFLYVWFQFIRRRKA